MALVDFWSRSPAGARSPGCWARLLLRGATLGPGGGAAARHRVAQPPLELEVLYIA